MYAFLSGPALWAAVIICIGGLIVRLTFLYGVSRERDRVIYNHADAGWGFRSILHWLIPWGSRSMRRQPVFTFMFFLFHITLIGVPLFLSAHNVLFDDAFGVHLWTLPNGVADVLAWAMLVAGVFLLVRRIVRPEVRILTEVRDYLLLLLTMAPFATGIIVYHQWGDYALMMNLHIAFGELLLILIPFTKLGHVVLFFFTRAFIGFEMGGRRGAVTW